MPASAVIDAAEAARGAGITLYAVGLGPSLDAAVLRGVAGDPARYYPAEDPDLLGAIYADLARRVPCPPSAYWGRR